MTLFAYLDEFGHVGPYVGRQDPRYKESPVFGFAGFVLPAEAVRGFGTWFFQRKCELLAIEIERSGEHPALWEKKGASLYTVTNVTRYPELCRFTNRLFNKIERLGGFVFYVGVRKTAAPGSHNPNRLYARVFLEAIKRIDGYCGEDCEPPEEFVLRGDDLHHVGVAPARQTQHDGRMKAHQTESGDFRQPAAQRHRRVERYLAVLADMPGESVVVVGVTPMRRLFHVDQRAGPAPHRAR